MKLTLILTILYLPWFRHPRNSQPCGSFIYLSPGFAEYSAINKMHPFGGITCFRKHLLNETGQRRRKGIHAKISSGMQKGLTKWTCQPFTWLWRPKGDLTGTALGYPIMWSLSVYGFLSNLYEKLRCCHTLMLIDAVLLFQPIDVQPVSSDSDHIYTVRLYIANTWAD